MFNKKILVLSLSLVVIMFIVVLLISNDNDNDSMFTRMVTIVGERGSSYVDNDMKIVEVNTDEDSTNISEIENEEVVEEVVSLIVYDGMTLEELASKLDRTFKNELYGKGYLYASYSLEKGVDPYLAAAISMEETGCNWNCSNLVRSCNNVGGMKGSGCGSYGYFNTLDDGIRAFIDNIQRNYVAYGLTTAEAMNSKYAENPLWSRNVNNYIERIKYN